MQKDGKETYHLKTLISVRPGQFSRRCIYSRGFSSRLCGFPDRLYCCFELGIEFASHWMADIVAEIIGSNKEHVDAVYSRDGLDLSQQSHQLPASTPPMAVTHILQRLLRLNLYNSN